MGFELNENCVNHKDCDSGYCSSGQCKTPGRYDPCNPSLGKGLHGNCPSPYVCHSEARRCHDTTFRLSPTGACKVGGQCKWTQYCKDGKCTDKKSIGGTCNRPEECAWEAICSGGKCMKKCGGLTGCQNDEECAGTEGEFYFCQKKAGGPKPAEVPPKKPAEVPPKKPAEEVPPKKPADGPSPKPSVPPASQLQPPKPGQGSSSLSSGQSWKGWIEENKKPLAIGGASLLAFFIILAIVIALVRKKKRRAAQGLDLSAPSSPFNAPQASQYQQQQPTPITEAPPAYEAAHQYGPDSKMSPNAKA